MSNAPLPPLPRSTSPWPWLARAISAASDPRALILAAIAMFCTARVNESIATAFDFPGANAAQESTSLTAIAIDDPRIFAAVPHALVTTLLAPAQSILQPLIGLFTADIPAKMRLGYLLSTLWTLVVFSIFGTAIARVVVVRLGNAERVGIVPALRFSVSRLGTLLSAPLVVIGVATGIALFGAVVGLLNRVAPGIASALAFVPLVAGLLNAVILLGLVAAWPLMVATVAVEGEDFFDVISRSYSYARQRAAQYLVYLLACAILGMVGLVLVAIFVKAALGLADWSISLGAPAEVGFRFSDELGTGGPATIGAFWSGIVVAIANGWSASYLFACTSIIYLLLRQDIDGSEMHEIYAPAQPEADPEPEAQAAEASE